MSLRGRSVSALAGLAVASGLILTMSPSAMASSGGGCHAANYKASGWKFRSCISARNNVVRPDFYIDKVGKHDRSCYIQVFLTKKADGGWRDIWNHKYSCKKGHVPYSMKTPRKAHGDYRFDVAVWPLHSAFKPLGVHSPVLHN
ncbi:hypothetical protein [Actinoallomurus sp. CA-150999]|uniref:hypothetical protein n=1 Tax=Actinoallomurus sp. CA-150999 TaxID=3239887 RepID=UPI003D8FEF32